MDDGRLAIFEGAIAGQDAVTSGQAEVRFFRNDDVSVWGTGSSDWAEKRLRHSSTVIEVDVVNFSLALQRSACPTT